MVRLRAPLALVLSAACQQDTPSTAGAAGSSSESSSSGSTAASTDTGPPRESAGSTGAAASSGVADSAGSSTTTNDTGEDPPTHLYPDAPYDCSAGVPSPPFEWSIVSGVTTTEDFAFDGEGYLVASDSAGTLLRWTPDASMQVLSPAAGESRGIDLLPDADLVFSNPDTGQIQRVSANAGVVSLYTSTMQGASGIDVAADGSVAVGDLNGYISIYDGPTGQLVSWGRVASQLYGAAFSPDESGVYFASYSPTEPSIYVTDRADDGTWPEPTVWTDFSTLSLAGLAVDACGNLYAMNAFDCALWRFDPEGQEELLLDLPVLPGGYCPALAFGRGLGGWDSETLYVSTYDEVVAVAIGVPGRPR